MRKNEIFGSDRLFAVMFGGRGCEHEISCKTAGNVINTARRIGYSILPVAIDKTGDFYIYLGDGERIGNGDCFSDAEMLLPTFPLRLEGKGGFFAEGGIVPVVSTLVALHGDHGEDGRIQGLLACAGIPYVGADTVSGALAYDKAAAKALVEKMGIPTVPWVLLTDRDESSALLSARTVGYPMFIKPSGLGSSIGVSAVRSDEEFYDAYRKAYALSGGRVLAEKYVERKLELECAYIDACGLRAITPPGAVNTDNRIYGYSEKYESKSAKLYALAEVGDDILALAREYTEKICNSLSLRHLARVDYFLTDDGELLFNEINTFPGMTDESLYFAMLSEYGINIEKGISALLEAPLWEGSR